MRRLWQSASKLIDTKLLRYMLVGGINTLVGWAILFGLLNLTGCGYWISSAVSYILSSILSFFLNKYFTFRSHGSTWREVLRFALTIAVCYGLAFGIAQPLVERILAGSGERVRDNVAAATGSVLFAGLNYLGQRLFTFREKTQEKAEK